jgi:hypothetical protein
LFKNATALETAARINTGHWLAVGSRRPRGVGPCRDSPSDAALQVPGVQVVAGGVDDEGFGLGDLVEPGPGPGVDRSACGLYVESGGHVVGGGDAPTGVDHGPASGELGGEASSDGRSHPP